MAQIKVSDIRKELTVGELFKVADNTVERVSAKGTSYETQVIPLLPVMIAGDVIEVKSIEKNEVAYAYEVFEPKTGFNFKVKSPNKLAVQFGQKVGLKNLVGGVAGNFVWFKAEQVGLLKNKETD